MLKSRTAESRGPTSEARKSEVRGLTPEVRRPPLPLRQDYGSAIDQELGARNDDLVSRLDSFEHDVVVARHVSDSQRLLMRDGLAVLLLGDEREVLAAETRNGEYRNHGAVL